MSGLTHAVYDALTGETKSEHPDASSAFAAAAKIGGVSWGYVVGPINCPPKPNKDIVREERKEPDQEGPGLFD